MTPSRLCGIRWLPELGGAAKKAGQSQSHFRTDRSTLTQQLVDGLARDSNCFSQAGNSEPIVEQEVLSVSRHVTRVKLLDYSNRSPRQLLGWAACSRRTSPPHFLPSRSSCSRSRRAPATLRRPRLGPLPPACRSRSGLRQVAFRNLSPKLALRAPNAVSGISVIIPIHSPRRLPRQARRDNNNPGWSLIFEDLAD